MRQPWVHFPQRDEEGEQRKERTIEEGISDADWLMRELGGTNLLCGEIREPRGMSLVVGSLVVGDGKVARSNVCRGRGGHCAPLSCFLLMRMSSGWAT